MTASVTPGDGTAVRWVTDSTEYQRIAADLDEGVRLPVEARIEVADPWHAFRRARGGAWSVCLETLGPTDGWNVMGIEPTATCVVGPDHADGWEGDSLGVLTRALEAEAIHRPSGAPPMPGGWFGWLSYDIARELEALPTTTERDRPLPRLAMARFETVASWQPSTADGPTTLRVTSAPRVRDDPADAYERAREAVRSFIDRIRTGEDTTAWGDPTATIDFVPGIDRAGYRDRVNRIQEYIREGDTFQVNLSQRFDGDATIHPVDAYDALRQANPAPYAGLLETPDLDLVSTSPELLLEREGTVARTEPIAGTRPRGDSPAADAALADELRDDPKERAEHAMLVDLERNDLGRVCRPGSVEVTEYRRVDRYASVWHLVSVVEGRLEAEVTVGELLAAMLPGGTVTGAPKPRTMEIIDELEDRRRGPYTGSIAAIGFDGSIRANMVIRTLEHHDGQYRLRVGGGVVHDSDPDHEYDETLAKAAAIREAIATDPGGQS